MKDTYAIELGKRIRSVRGYTSREKAIEGIDVHANTLAKYEKGEREARVSFVLAFAKKFGVDVGWLLSGRIPPDGVSYNWLAEDTSSSNSTSQIHAADAPDARMNGTGARDPLPCAPVVPPRAIAMPVNERGDYDAAIRMRLRDDPALRLYFAMVMGLLTGIGLAIILWALVGG